MKQIGPTEAQKFHLRSGAHFCPGGWSCLCIFGA
jgi:hypothetical protein